MQPFPLDSNLVTGPDVPGAPAEPVLRIHEIQGNVLPGFNTMRQRLLGFRFDGAGAEDAVRAWIAATAYRVTTLARAVEQRNIRRAALRRGERRPAARPMLSIALSADGLRLLTADAAAMHDEAFKGGMWSRSSLGDPRGPDPGSPGTWLVGGSRETTPHVIVTLGGDERGDLERAGDRLVAEAQRTGAVVVFDQDGHVLPGGTEHFGFPDGISQPGARGRLSQLAQHYLVRRYICPDDPAALRYSRPGQPLVWPGQFVFGYPGQDGTDPIRPLDPPRPFGPEWMVDGSYLVFRRLRQDVAAFRAGMTELRAQIHAQAGVDVAADEVAQLLVGRRPDGTSLTRDPAGVGPDALGGRLGINHFGFATAVPPVCVWNDEFSGPEDPTIVAGAPADDPPIRCPRFAHIRKTNPRDLVTDLGDEADTLTRHVARRGITWGVPFESDPAAERGLLFLAYQTSIVDQFEVLNTRWMNRAGAPEGRSGHDLFVGQNHDPAGRSAHLRVGDTVVTLNTSTHWVVPTGGGYFFAPSVSTLRRFARRR